MPAFKLLLLRGFVALTGRLPRERHRVAVRACLAAGAVLAVFAVAGGAIFSFFGITVPAFQIAGGMLFTILSLREVQGDRQVPVAPVPTIALITVSE